jgi:hypothetical protein
MKFRAAWSFVSLLAGIATAQTTLATNYNAPSVESEKPMMAIPVVTRISI